MTATLKGPLSNVCRNVRLKAGAANNAMEPRARGDGEQRTDVAIVLPLQCTDERGDQKRKGEGKHGDGCQEHELPQRMN